MRGTSYFFPCRKSHFNKKRRKGGRSLFFANVACENSSEMSFETTLLTKFRLFAFIHIVAIITIEINATNGLQSRLCMQEGQTYAKTYCCHTRTCGPILQLILGHSL